MVEEKKKRIAKYNPEADKKWRKKNKERHYYMVKRSTARCFIRDEAKEEDLKELSGLIKKRMENI